MKNKENKAINLFIKTIMELVEKRIDQARYDKTFASAVYSYDAKKNTYMIVKDCRMREVHSSLEKNISVGQHVWVKIPCGNLKDMHICGLR